MTVYYDNKNTQVTSRRLIAGNLSLIHIQMCIRDRPNTMYKVGNEREEVHTKYETIKHVNGSNFNNSEREAR